MTASHRQDDVEHVDLSADGPLIEQRAPLVIPHRMLIGSGLLMGFSGLLLTLLGNTAGESAFDGVRSAAILMLFALLASFEGSARLIGRIGYYLGLAAALTFGLNFARLGYKWFDPARMFALAPPIAVLMSGSCLFSFYRICKARRDYAGAVFAIAVTVSAVLLSRSWNGGQGLVGIDSSYTLALFVILVGAVVWRFQTAIVEFFQNNVAEKLELAPVALIAVIAIAGAIKFTSTAVPQGAMATVGELITGTEETIPTIDQPTTPAELPTTDDDPSPEKGDRLLFR